MLTYRFNLNVVRRTCSGSSTARATTDCHEREAASLGHTACDRTEVGASPSYHLHWTTMSLSHPSSLHNDVMLTRCPFPALEEALHTLTSAHVSTPVITPPHQIFHPTNISSHILSDLSLTHITRTSFTVVIALTPHMHHTNAPHHANSAYATFQRTSPCSSGL
jgi:hypothetical protein